MSATMLEVNHLGIEVVVQGSKRLIVSDMSLSVEAGEVVGLIGESGSGKSMTARAVVAHLPGGARASGSILFEGADVLTMSRSQRRKYLRKDVAMVFQDPRAHINPVRTVGDFLTERMRLDGTSRAEAQRRAVRLLEDVHVARAASVIRRYPHELSGGMLQRVMIASAMATSPKLIIADEPTTALDVTTQSEVIAILNEMRDEQGMGMLFITHDLDLAAAICDRVSVAYAGRTVESQPAATLVAAPLHPYTAALLEAQPELAGTADRLKALPGAAVSAWEAPQGCSFAPRCEHVQMVCGGIDPELRAVAAGHVACRRAEELAPSLARNGGATPDA